MADPLSIGASVVTLLDTSSTCLAVLLKLIKCAQNAPFEIQALLNDLSDLQGFFEEVKNLCDDIIAGQDQQQSKFLQAAYRPLEDAGKALVDLEKILKTAESHTSNKRSRLGWVLQRAKAKKIHQNLRRLKSDIEAVLLLSTKADGHHLSSRIFKIEARLEDLHSTILSCIQPGPSTSFHVLQPQLENTTASLTQAPDTASTSQDHSSTADEDTHSSISQGTTEIAPREEPKIDASSNGTLQPNHVNTDTFLPNNTMFFHLRRARRCVAPCPCVCHSAGRYKNSLLKNYLGTLFLGYSGSPGFWPKCNVKACRNTDKRSINLVYCFPLWFSKRALHASATLSSSLGWTMQLSIRRRVPWGGGQDSLLKFALTGNVDGAKSLLDDRKASLNDADPNHGRTALHYAVLRNKTSMCTLLLAAGADPFLQDDYGTTPFQKAWEQILCKRGTVAELDGLKRVFSATEELEAWEFSYLHKVVLGLFPGQLARELESEQYRHHIHAADSMKRTPLHWAATRGDEDAVRCLLEAGADVNCRDDFGNTPLTFAASTGSVRLLELLILHGADVHARTSIGSQAIHHASRHQRAIEPVRTLLRAGASLNSTNSFGQAPLSGAAIANCLAIGAFLLDAGADMHTRSLHGDTPLFETVFHNNHLFLTMLLDRGADPLHGVNNAGSTILHAAALEADARTVHILRTTAGVRWRRSHFSLRDHKGATALEIARRRVSPPEGFLDEFEKLVAAAESDGEDDSSCG
ncbi:hypothetical protein Z517_08630 [Fonsecaea pedrosoi CBS 271.37]|uniref:Fungal N-terminal domain-containing protein n=1 Tax=Fonsecaea pedrosoi CBS 271.37 TaxID=1442368 RepID=A0A0D2DM61_9EURO|nr:uncharacterized protein Z517_08630 [Fonsecaea pedrosoi CBS 271.37]KIW78791.1 hypothetical protein Z517_08630 [Fonsecaea pedrosoi CBS 271.37]